LLKVCKLTSERNEQVLFQDLNFTLDAGSWLWVRGSNGAGKSTLLKIVAGLISPTAGNVLCKTTKFYLGHKLNISAHLTPIENLKWGIEPFSLCIKEVLKILKLTDFENTPCGLLSHGQKQRVALARLWGYTKKIWILDEPLNGLDAVGQGLFLERFASHLKQGGSAVIASHLALGNVIPENVIHL